MQEFKFLTQQISVAGQLQPEDMQRAHAAGFKTVVNNRPDAEEVGQPTNQAIAQAAKQLDLDYHYLPIVSGQLTDANVAEFAELLPQLELPVLLFCRSGTRCTHLWALVQSATADLEQLSLQAQQAGYDLTDLAERMRQRQGDTVKDNN